MAYGRELPSYHEDAPAHGLCNCCCCLSLSLLLFLLVAIGIALFFVLVMKPTKPEFELQSVTLQSFQVDKQVQDLINFAVYLSMNITLIFSASNPNKVAIEYSPTELHCIYKNALLGVANVPSFTQPAHSHTALTAVVVVNHLNVLQSSSMELLNDATVKDEVPLSISGPVEARVNVLGINSPKVKVFVDCKVVVHPMERAIGSKACNVGQLTLSD